MILSPLWALRIISLGSGFAVCVLRAIFADAMGSTILQAMRQQQEDLLRCEGTTATTAGSSAPVSEGSVQDLAGILSAL